MKRIIFALMAIAMWVQGMYAQNTMKISIVDQEDGEPLIGVTAKVDGTETTAISDADGNMTIGGMADGEHSITFSYIGYEKKTERYTLPMADSLVTVTLHEEEEELGGVVV